MAEDEARKELEPRSDLELANSWLKRETEETSKRLRQITTDEGFYRTYKPTVPTRPSYIERGSKDASDWDAAEAEYRQWPEEQEERLNDLERENDVLTDKYSDLVEYRSRMEAGDPQVIAELAGRERARLAALEKQEKERKEYKEGIELEGVGEVVKQIEELSKLEKAGVEPRDWKRVYSSQDGYRYLYGVGKGSDGGFVTSIAIGKGDRELREQDEITIRYRDFSQTRLREPGVGLFFHINGDRVKNHSVLGLTPWAGGMREQTNKGLMTQEHFDRFREHLNLLIEGVKQK